MSSELSNDLSGITAEINSFKKILGEAVFEIGKRLKHVKENDLAHGEFIKWCERAAKISRQQSARFMKIYEIFKDNPEQITGVSVSVLYEVITEDDPQLFLEKVKGKTIREIRRIKRLEASREIRKRTTDKAKRNKYILCSCCGIDCTPIVQWHHIVPLANGGKSGGENLIPLCPNCHAVIHGALSEKNEKFDVDSWLQHSYSAEARKRLLHLILFSIDKDEAIKHNGKFTPILMET